MIKSYQLFLESDKDNLLKNYSKILFGNYDIPEIEKVIILNEDGSIDIEGDIDLSRKKLTKLPIVGGDLSYRGNQLTNLDFTTKEVGGHFDCSNNLLTSLEGCPKEIGGLFSCTHNQLTSLEGGPEKVLGDEYYFDNNKITNFKGFPEFWEGRIRSVNNPIENILRKFPLELKCRAIHLINDYDAIQNGKVIEDRMDEVKAQLNII